MPTATRQPVSWLEQLRQQASTAAWVVLLGPLPAGEEDDWIDAAGHGGVPVLVIVPQLEQADRLQERLHGEGRRTVKVCSELLAAAAGDVCWYRYNDARRNGTTPLEVLQARLPNLRLESQEWRRQCSLAEVLDGWSSSLPQPPGEGGLLWLPAALAEAVLAGCGLWLQRLRVLQVAGEPEDPAGLAERLEALCFRLGSEAIDPQLWRLDALRVLQAERDRLVVERQGLAANVAELQQLQATMNSEREGLLAERTGFGAERAGLLAERDRLLAERDAWLAEREGMIAERDRLLGERDGWIAEREGLHSRQLQISTELDEILALLEATPAEVSRD